MASEVPDITTCSHSAAATRSPVTQLAIAPVFLLNAVAAIINVLASRLARVVDRIRQIENRKEPFTPEDLPVIEKEMREIIGADSLAFLSIDGMYRAMGEPGRDPANPKFSDHCFTGVYPTHLTDQTQVEPQPRQLSLLAEAS